MATATPTVPNSAGRLSKSPVFFPEASYKRYNNYDGFYFSTSDSMIGRIKGQEYFLNYDPVKKEYLWRSLQVEFRLDSENRFLSGDVLNGLLEDEEIDMRAFYIMRVLFDGIRSDPDEYPSVMLSNGYIASR